MTPSPTEPSGPCATPVGQAGYSRFFQRLQRRYEQDLVLLPPGAPDKATMAHAFAALQARGCDTATALRVLRQLVMERLIRLDCDAQAPLSDITRAVFVLAGFALDRACLSARRRLSTRHAARL